MATRLLCVARVGSAVGGPESENGQPAPTTALATLAIALPQLLELAAVLRLAGLLFDLLDKLLAPWASRKILDELAD
jgi:hypothetical protein